MSAPKAVTVGNTATLLAAKAEKRVAIYIQNLDAADVFLGEDATVTVANGYALAANGGRWVEIFDNPSFYTGTWYAISAAGSADVRVYERLAPGGGL